VLERAFLSTHPDCEDVFNVLLESYEINNNTKIMNKLNEVRKRGRKKIAFG
jgi:TP53 regulating kinase-like protein